MSLVEEIGVPEGSPTVVVDGVRIAYARAARGISYACTRSGTADGISTRLPRLFAISSRSCASIGPVQGRSSDDAKAPSAATDEITRVCNSMSRFFAAGARKAWWFGPAF